MLPLFFLSSLHMMTLMQSRHMRDMIIIIASLLHLRKSSLIYVTCLFNVCFCCVVFVFLNKVFNLINNLSIQS